MRQFRLQSVSFRYQISEKTLFKCQRKLQVLGFGIEDGGIALDKLKPLLSESDGFMLRSLPLSGASWATEGNNRKELDGQYLFCYVMQRFPRYFIDMSISFDEYKSRFSGKTRSTLNRKVKKFSESTGGKIHWERFACAKDLDRFWQLAREVSAKTYQERLLDAGLPDSAAYFERAKRLAEEDNIRAFLLFDGKKPVAYLYCPVNEGILNYSYLGYDPAYFHLSVGTILQWLALESLFAEQRFRFFDFTEGESEQKKLFATGSFDCANVALLRTNLANRLLAFSHLWFGRAAEGLGNLLEKYDLKIRVRRWLRFGRAGS